MRFTAKELSTRTWGDFERLFAEGTGWGPCGCLFALKAPRSRRGPWAQQRRDNLRTMRGLVEQRRSQGILVYDGTDPVGWCQLVPRAESRFADATGSDAAWFLSCFVVDPRYRGHGVTGAALRAAVKAVGRKGGGIVVGHATAVVPGPPPKPERKGVHRDGDVLFYEGKARVRYGFEVEGVGPVVALYRTGRTMHGAPLGGTVEGFRREGFEAVAVLPRPASARAALIDPDRIVMRRTV